VKSDTSLHSAALASADLISAAIASVGVTSGLLDSMDTFRSADEIRRRWGVADEKSTSLVAVLDLMVDQGLVERRGFPVPAYRRAPSPPGTTRGDILAELRRQAGADPTLADWLHPRHADVVWEAQRAFLGDRLDYLFTPDGQLTFDATFEDAWRANLTNPLYEFGRLFCVGALARRHGRYLDLASGVGYGIQRLVEWSDGHASVVALDKSADFIAMSRRLLQPPTATVVHRVWDLNDGLPALPAATFDGALFTGAFHYIKDKAGLLRQIHNVLKPSGRLAIGQCYVRSGLRDDATNRYMFSLAADRSYIVTRQELNDLLTRAGFTFVADQPRGSQYSVVVQKGPDAVDEG
jgi:SAM-dependent methyltransferase